MSDHDENEEYMSENDAETVDNSPQALDDDFDMEADLQILKDASLRLEQGNLYKMLLKHDLFDGVEADPRAVQNVQREIRTFIRERLEILVGLRQDPKLQPKTQSLGFSSEEVMLLKGMLSKVLNKGENRPAPLTNPEKPKISAVTVKERPKTLNKISQTTTTPVEPERKLDKPVKDMTVDELIQYNKKVSATQALRKASPIKKMPMPDAQQMTSFYSSKIAADPGQSFVGAIMKTMGVQMGHMESVDSGNDDSNDSRM